MHKKILLGALLILFGATLSCSAQAAKHTADFYIRTLALQGHVEGGYFKEVYKNEQSVIPANNSNDETGKQALSSTIYYLLKSGEKSSLHKLKSDEIWFFHDGSPMLIYLFQPNGEMKSVRLGLNAEKGEVPQILVPAGSVFGAEVSETDSFGLVSCMVSPGFDYRDFELCDYQTLLDKYPKYSALISRMVDAK